MKYINEYLDANGDKKVFIKLMINRYPELALSTMERRYYDCRKYHSEKLSKSIKKEIREIIIPKKKQYNPEDFPLDFPRLKLIKLNDMIKFKKGQKLDYNFLRNEGFTTYEIEMLREKGVI